MNKIKKKIKYFIKSIFKEVTNESVYINPNDFIFLPKNNLSYSEDLLYTYHNADFINDPLFKESYRLGKATDKHEILLKNYDIRWRIHVLCWAALHATHL